MLYVPMALMIDDVVVVVVVVVVNLLLLLQVIPPTQVHVTTASKMVKHAPKKPAIVEDFESETIGARLQKKVEDAVRTKKRIIEEKKK